MTKQKALIIHGFEGDHLCNWFPWLQAQLTQKGFFVINKTLPNPSHPNFKETMTFLEAQTKNFDSNDIIIGHSLGAFWAVKLAEKKTFKSVVLVAPAISKDLPFSIMKQQWTGSDIAALEKIMHTECSPNKIQSDHKIAFFSTDDPWIPQHIKQDLDSEWEIVDLERRGHVTDDRLNEVLKYIQS